MTVCKIVGLAAALTLSAFASVAASAAALSPDPPPHRQTLTVEAECAGTVFRLIIDIDRFGMARLRSVTSGGVALDNESTRAIAAFLSSVRSGWIVGTHCVSATQAAVALSGSRLNVGPGEEDDVTDWFLLNLTSAA
jgi:hypothetical protein